jgi:transketolase
MVVINPCDFNQTKNATIAAAKYNGAVYLRFGRPKWPNFTDPDEPFEIGKAYVMNEGKDVTIFATGHLVWEALGAAQALEAEGICAEVIDIATIKPLDTMAVINSIRKTRCAVVAEEHNVCGGLGELIAGVLATRCPTPLEFINGGDRFGQSGTPSELLAAYGLDSAHIVEAAKKVLDRKN